MTYLLLHGVIGLTNQQVFLFCTPTIILYYIAFRWVYMDSLRGAPTTCVTQTIIVTPSNDATHSTSQLSPVVADTETPLLVNRPVIIIIICDHYHHHIYIMISYDVLSYMML